MRGSIKRCRGIGAACRALLLLCLSSVCAVAGAPKLFLADDAYFVVWTIDARSGAIERGFSVPAEASCRGPRIRSGVAFDGRDLYYTHDASRRIWVLDPSSGALRRTLEKPALDFSGLAADGEALYALTSARTRGLLQKLDPTSGASLAEWSIPGGRQALAAAPSTSSLYVAVGSLEIRRLDAGSGALQASLPAPAAVTGLAYSEEAAALFAVSTDGTVFELDPETGEVRGTAVAADAAGHRISRPGGLAVAEVGAPADPEREGKAEPQEPLELLLQVQDTTFAAGTSGRVPILLTSALETQGFVIAALHEPAVLVLEAIGTEETATALFGADFTASELLPNGGTLGVIFDLLPPFEDNVLTAGENLVIAHYQYRCFDIDLQEAITTVVRLADGILGSPPKDNIIVHQGRAVAPELSPGTITCVPRPVLPGGPEFFCGGKLGPDFAPLPLAARSGERAGLCLHYAFAEPQGKRIQGLSMALGYDCRLSCIESSFHLPPDSITAQVRAEFVSFHCDNDPDDGDGCEMVLGILVDFLPPFDGASLPPSPTPLLLACVELEVGGGVNAGECLEVRFRDGLDGRENVPIRNLVSLDAHSVPAKAFPCEVCVTAAGPSLFCGSGELGRDGRPGVPSGEPGSAVDFCLWYASPGEEVLALRQSLRFDCRLECLDGAFELAAEGLEGLDPELVQFQCGGESCTMAVAILAGEDPERRSRLPASNRPQRLGCVRMRISGDAPRGSCLAVEHVEAPLDGLFNEIETAAGRTEPHLFDCRVCVLPAEPPRFFCGGPLLGENGRPVRIEEVARGARAELCFWYASPVDELTRADEIQGISMALCFDCTLICIEDSFRIPPDSITALAGAEFVEFHCDNDPLDGDGCEMVLGILVDYLPPFDGRTLPPSHLPLKLACVDMEVDTRAKLGFCLDVDFCDGADGRRRVPIKNLVSVENHAFPPQTFDCEICVRHLGPKFLCGGGELGPDNLPVIPGGKPGEPVEVCFWYCSPEDDAPGHRQFDHLQGLSMAIAFDCRLECIEESFRVPSDAITAALGAEYVEFQCDNDPGDGDGCEAVLAILIDAHPPFDGRTLPPADVPLKLACVDFRLPEDGICDECYEIRFEDGVNGRNRIPTFNLVAAENHSFLALTSDCKVCVTDIDDPVFRRGDCNDDESVDLSDAASIIAALFGVGTWKAAPPCLDACDANDDGRIDLADARFLLEYLFLFGPPPPAPGPDSPGPDPTADKIECAANPCP
jgi:hypothetical protein